MSIYKKILVILVCISIVFSGVYIGKRFTLEQRNSNVEVVADMDEFVDLAMDMGKSIEELSRDLISSGVVSLAVTETNLNKLQERGEVVSEPLGDFLLSSIDFGSAEIRAQVLAWANQNRSQISVENTSVILVNDYDTYNFLRDAFNKRMADHVIALESETGYGLIIKKKLSKINSIGLGFRYRDLDYAQSLGFNNIVPRVENYKGITNEDIDELVAKLKSYKVGTVIFAGNSVLGQDNENDEKLKYVGEKFSEDGKEIITAIIEKPVETDVESIQKGTKALAKASEFTSNKVFSVDTAQLAKLKVNALVDQWSRAISSRNVRIIYLRPLSLKDKTSTENYTDTLNAVRQLRERVKHMGYKYDTAKAFSKIQQIPYIQMVIALGVVAGTMLLLALLFKQAKWMYIIGSLGAIGTVALYIIPVLYNVLGDLGNKIFAFAASIVFPSIAGIYLIDIYKKYSKDITKYSAVQLIRKSILMVIVAVLISAVGGILVAGLLSDTKYILKLDVFRGVKLSFILPILIVLFAYVLKVGFYVNKNKEPLSITLQAKKLLNTSITVKYGLAALVVLGAFAIIMLRSGNASSSAISGIETMLRNFLETYLVARPRSKELIAFPILMLLPIVSKFDFKQTAFIVIMVGMIGLENIVNSFCHIRMPLAITALSSTYSLIFGIIVGSILIAIVYKIKLMYDKKKAKN